MGGSGLDAKRAADVVHLRSGHTWALCGAWFLDATAPQCTGDLEAVSCPKCLFHVRAARAAVMRGKRVFKVRRTFKYTVEDGVEAYTDDDARHAAMFRPAPPPASAPALRPTLVDCTVGDP